MEVELRQDLLTARQREDLALLALCAFGLSGRHRILLDAFQKAALFDGFGAGFSADFHGSQEAGLMPTC